MKISMKLPSPSLLRWLIYILVIVFSIALGFQDIARAEPYVICSQDATTGTAPFTVNFTIFADEFVPTSFTFVWGDGNSNTYNYSGSSDPPITMTKPYTYTQAGTYNPRGSATDGSWNPGCDFQTVTVSTDTTPPTLSNVRAEDITQTTTNIKWTTNEAGSSRVEYGLTTSYGNQTNEINTNPRVTSHTVGLSGLTCNTTYNYRAKSKDAALNQGVSANKTFITASCPVPPGTPPPPPGSGPPLGTPPPPGTPPSPGTSPPAGRTTPPPGTPGAPPPAPGSPRTPGQPPPPGTPPPGQAPPGESAPPSTMPTVTLTAPPPSRNPVVQFARDTLAPVTAIATATLVVPTVLTALTASVAASLSGFTIQPGLLRLLQLFSFSSFLRRRRPPWGEVIDEITRAVIPGALVELVKTETTKVVDRTTTDRQGRFVLLVAKPGSYRFRVTAQSFRPFLSPDFAIDKIDYIPKGQTIALHPLQPKISQGKLKTIVIAQQVAQGLRYTRIPLLVVGIMLTATTLVNEFGAGRVTVLSLLIAGLYLALTAFEVKLQLYKKPYGKVIDRRSDKPLELAIVRAFKLEKGLRHLCATQVTDQLGRFSFLVSPGIYEFDAIKIAYLHYKSDPHNLTGQHTLVNEKIELTPIRHGQAVV